MNESRSIPRANGVEEETEIIGTPQNTVESHGPALWTPTGKRNRPASSDPSDSGNIAKLWQQEPDRSYALLAAIVESSDDAIISNDLDGTITSWNKGAERVFGYTAAEMLGHPTSKLAAPSCQEDTERVLEKIRRGESVDHYETLRRHKDGSEIIVSMTVSPIRNSSGDVIGASKVSRDISQMRRAEQSMRNADKLALAGRMAASIAHEINNPLEAITNLLYLVEHETLSDEARGYLTLAQDELARVSHIAAQTLGFFRNSSEPSLTPLSEIVDSALSLHLGRLSTHKMAIHREYAPLPLLFLHQGELRQVLANLIGNALDAMPAGGRLRVRIRKAFDPKTKASGARIIIADTGTGMNSATMRQIFEPFYTTKGSAGTGLGLWVSSQIIARHRGRISVRSSQSPRHSGTVFSIFLPNLTDTAFGYPEEDPVPSSQQMSLPIYEVSSTSRGDASRHTPAQPDPQSAEYNAA